MVHARTSGNVRDSYDYHPVPPLPHTTYRLNTREVFFWGYPEPFPFYNDTAWTPPRTRFEALYPLRYQETLILATCFSKRLEGTFPNVRGLTVDTFALPVDAEGLLPARELVQEVEAWAKRERVRLRRLPQYHKPRRRRQVKSAKAKTGKGANKKAARRAPKKKARRRRRRDDDDDDDEDDGDEDEDEDADDLDDWF